MLSVTALFRTDRGSSLISVCVPSLRDLPWSLRLCLRSPVTEPLACSAAERHDPIFIPFLDLVQCRSHAANGPDGRKTHQVALQQKWVLHWIQLGLLEALEIS